MAEEKIIENNQDYTDENYIEDKKLSHYALFKLLRLYPFLENDKDIIYSEFLYTAYKLRKTYDVSKGVKYSTYVLKNLHYIGLNFITKHANDKNNSNASLDANIVNDSDDFTFYNLLFEDFDFDINIRYRELLSYIENVLLKFNSKHVEIINDYLKNFDFVKVSKKFNTTRQNVFVIINKFRYYLKAELLNNGFVDEKFFTNTITFSASDKINFTEISRKHNIKVANLYVIKRAYLKTDKSKPFEEFVVEYLKHREKMKNMSQYEKNKLFRFKAKRNLK